MTSFSEHAYAARVLDPGGDIVLSLDEDSPGNVSLDASRIPHVQADIIVAFEDASLLDLLDPRDSRRVVVEARRSDTSVVGFDPVYGDPRVFDLGIREASPDRAAGTVTLQLASDEALLSDFAPVIDDRVGPWARQSSLRDICEYVLDKIGATLEPGPLDADMTAYWSATNLFTNPSFENTVAGWANGTLATGLAPTTAQKYIGNYSGHWQTTGGGSSFIDFNGPISVEEGRTYTFEAMMRATVARPARLLIRFKNAAAVVLADRYGPVTNLLTTAWSTVFNDQVAPAGSTQVSAHIEYQASAAGQFPYVDAMTFYEGDRPVPYFDGAGGYFFPDGYTFAWTGTPHASTSVRTPLVEREPESVTWRAGVSGMSFLEPLLKSAGLRLVCDEQRRWTLRDAEYRADGTQSYRYGVNTKTAVEQLSRTADDWFDAAVYEYRWTDASGIEQRRLDTYSLTEEWTKVLHVLLSGTVFPGPGRAENIVKRAQGRGRTVTVSAIPTWTEQTDQTLSILLEGTPDLTGISGSISFDLGADTVTVTSRTVDIPAGAIDLLTGTINALTGTINDL